MNRLSLFIRQKCQRWRRRELQHALTRLGAGAGCATLALRGRAPVLDVTGKIELGDHVTFCGTTRLTTITVGEEALLKIGAHSFLNQGGNFAITCGVTLGRNCLVAEEVSFFDSNYHEVDQDSGVISASIVIGDNVWIGHGAIILPGARIGSHSVVAAGAVVRGEFPARSLVGGVPARLIRGIRCADNYIRA